MCSLVDALCMRAQKGDDKPIYTFLRGGEVEEASLSAIDLDRCARTIASRICRQAGERVILAFAPGPEFVASFFGCWYAGLVGVPVPLPIGGQEARVKAIIKDCGARVVLTSPELESHAKKLLDGLCEVVSFDLADFLPSEMVHAPSPVANSSAISHLQYTSGSTGSPKGVVVSHSNIVHNLEFIATTFGIRQGDASVIWLPHFHDMGLVYGLLLPIFNEHRCIAMSPAAFVERPLRWLEAVMRYGATHSAAPNFAFDYCVRRSTEDERQALDLSSWTVAINGSEPVHEKTMDRFAKAFSQAGFRRDSFKPAYGLAEVTLMGAGTSGSEGPRSVLASTDALERHELSVVDSDGPDARTLTSVGRADPRVPIEIVDPETSQPLQEGQVGEIWLSGPSVVERYWGDTAATDMTFKCSLPGKPGIQFMRTGDLGVLLDGALYMTGRSKDLIVIRGANFYPDDIEHTVQGSSPILRPGCGAAFSVERDTAEELIVIYELAKGSDASEFENVAEAARNAVSAEHDIHIHTFVLIETGALSKTPTGKIQRSVCRTRFVRHDLPIVAVSVKSEAANDSCLSALIDRDSLLTAPAYRRNSLLVSSIELWAAAALCRPVVRQGPEAHLSSLGLDSIDILRLQHDLEKAFDIQLKGASPLIGQTLDSIAQLTLSALESTPTIPVDQISVADAENRGILSRGQKAMWVLHQISPESSEYNIPIAVRIKGGVDHHRAEVALNALITRHDTLRTGVGSEAGEPTLVHCASSKLTLIREDVFGWDHERLDSWMAREAQKPFNIAEPPLIRAFLLEESPQSHILMIVLHHIAADLWSMAILLDEWSMYYQQESVDFHGTEIACSSYRDFSCWQEKMLRNHGSVLWDYWRGELETIPPPLDLPTDRERQARWRGVRKRVPLRLDRETSDSLRALAQAEHTTLYTVLMTAFQILLARWTGQYDFLVGSPVSGRTRSEFTGTVGYFVNTVVHRARINPEKSLGSALCDVRESVVNALKHADLPFDLLVEMLSPRRSAGHPPLVQVLFVFQQLPASRELFLPIALAQERVSISVGDLRIESVAPPEVSSAFDFSVSLGICNGGVVGSFEYDSSLFDEESIRRSVEHFSSICRSMVGDRDCAIGDLDLTLRESDESTIVRDTDRQQIERDETLHGLFEEVAIRQPDAIALVREDEQWTYGQLERSARRVACTLQEAGVSREDTVGVCATRSPLLVVALLGILKAGAAYVPLVPEYPRERLHAIIDDGSVRLALVDREGHRVLEGYSGERLDIGSIASDKSRQKFCESGVCSENLAYVIYTSGSTGDPKGVEISHKNAVALVKWAVTTFQLGPSQGILASTSIAFDLSVFEIFGTLHAGGRIVLADSALELATLESADSVTVLNTVPSAIQELSSLCSIPRSVHTVNLAGETLRGEVVKQLYEFGIEAVFNLYGPSEDTTYSTIAHISPDDAIPSIGRPIAGTRAFLLDFRYQRVPDGARGELYLAGDGVARGYRGQPALTAQRFVPGGFAGAVGHRMYRTGDLGRLASNGDLSFLGRVDRQIKIRGFRIEPAEIEVSLEKHKAIDAAVVVPHTDRSKQTLVAFVVSREYPGAEALHCYLACWLPLHMIPGHFVCLSKIPRTPNGKIDSRALVIPETSRRELEVDFVAPRNELEAEIAHIWRLILGRDQIGVDDDFFRLGGHSLQATRVIARIRETLAVDLSAREIFETPTVSELAAGIDARRTSTLDLGQIEQVLDSIEQLTADEARAELGAESNVGGD